MYLTMNRFKVKPDAESQAAFEEIWLSRESKLTQVPGFVEFHMLRGPEGDEYRLYSSHTMWESKAAVEAVAKAGGSLKTTVAAAEAAE